MSVSRVKESDGFFPLTTMLEVGKDSGGKKLWKKRGESGLETGAHPSLSGTDADLGSGGRKPGARSHWENHCPCVFSPVRLQVLPAASGATSLVPAPHRGPKREPAARPPANKTPCLADYGQVTGGRDFRPSRTGSSFGVRGADEAGQRTKGAGTRRGAVWGGGRTPPAAVWAQCQQPSRRSGGTWRAVWPGGPWPWAAAGGPAR